MVDLALPALGRSRSIRRRPFPNNRRFVLEAMRAGRRTFPIHGLLELDVTEAVAVLDSHDEPLSFTAFVVAATARSAAVHPLVHAYRDWRGRLVLHEHVDVATMVEVDDEGRSFPLVHVLRDADVRTVEDLSDDIRSVGADSEDGGSVRFLRGPVAALARIPGLVRLFYRALAHSARLRDKSGTVSVTSVGMFGGGGGTGIGQPTIMTVTVLVGGRSMRPRVVEGEIVPRLVLDLTISVDHAIVDGAPAARFAATLTDLIEHPSWVDAR